MVCLVQAIVVVFFFNWGETEVHSVYGYTVHKKGSGKVMQGGTGLVLISSQIQQYDFESSRNHGKGLGRQITILIHGSNGGRARITFWYNLCANTRHLGQATSNIEDILLEKKTTAHT